MKTRGIDVSRYQENIDFSKVAASGIEFVIIQAGYGHDISQKDPYFEQNYAAAKAAGLKVGAYWFSYASDPEDARKEAAVCAEAVKGKQFDYPIYYDLENDESSNYFPFSKGRDHCSALVTAFCTELEKHGYFAGLYISRVPLQTHISADVARRFALWIAEYGDKCNYNDTYGMWQYTSTASVPGINKGVDADICYIDYPAQIKAAGLNGFPKPVPAKPAQPKAPEPEKKPLNITVEIDGSKYSGTIEKQ